MNRIDGSEDHDRLRGTMDTDRIRGFGGSDQIYGRGGEDNLEGGTGIDTLYGGRGNDYLADWTGSDIMHGGGGDDWFVVETDSSGPATGQVKGGGGDDGLSLTTNGQASVDMHFVTGGDGQLFDSYGVSGIEILQLTTGAGADQLNATHGTAGAIQWNAGGGWDHAALDFSTISGAAELSFSSKFTSHIGGWTSDNGVHNVLRFTDVERFTITGNDEDNMFAMSEISGRDLLVGLGGADTLSGGGGRDRLLGGKGHDALKGGTGRDTLLGGAGHDYLEDYHGNGLLKGGNGRDTMSAGDGNDRLIGGGGADSLNAGEGDDILRGGGGADVFVFARDHGHDVIDDFQMGRDQIRLVGLGDPGDLAYRDTAAGVEITTSLDNTLLLRDVSLEALLGSDSFI